MIVEERLKEMGYVELPNLKYHYRKSFNSEVGLYIIAIPEENYFDGYIRHTKNYTISLKELEEIVKILKRDIEEDILQ